MERDHLALGRLPAPDGHARLRVPPGTQSGRIFTLRGGGVPYLNSHRRGDLRVVVEVGIPEKLSAEEEKLLRRLAELRGEEVVEHRGFFDRLKQAFT